ncbi:BglG family transcription antiterminator [Streptococcus thoraltensis]|uniref:BglG family transcription antiterminator n=1 Tax=Streptococcus thoraltensis TaxID=55085 RepID=UPI001F5ABD38|nr:PTS sugar transporter subunit IIA [Streptococcus thoraltensis]
MITKRQQNLIQILRKEKSFHKVSELSKILGCSQRTLYSDIETLKQNGFDIISKRGVGIKLVEDGIEDSLIENISLDETVERRIIIIKRIFINEEIITLNKLSEEYLVSQTSIKTDLEVIENVLDDGLGAFLKKDKLGTRLITMPLERKLNLLTKITQFIMSNVVSNQLELTTASYDILGNFYSDSIVKVANNIVYSFFRKNIATIPDVYIDNFFHFFLALLSQLSNDKHIDYQISEIDKSKHAFYIGSATSLLHKASLRLKINYTNEDVQYLSQMLVNYRIEQKSFNFEKNELDTIINKVSEVMGNDFSKDDTLKKQLEAHVSAMLSRLKFGTIVKNPFLEQIKIDFSILFNSIWIAMEHLSEFLEVTFNEDEIAFLTLYFQLSIEKNGNVRRILVVCPTGIVTSELLINRIKKLAPSLDEVEVASIDEFLELDASRYDLILTTTKIETNKANIHHISAFAKNEEISEILHHSLNYSYDDSSSFSNDIPNYVLLNQQFGNKTSLLNSVKHYLTDKKLALEGFVESIKEREKLGSTELPAGVAIPHGKSEYVNESFVIYIQNKRKIKWSEHFVDSIFIIGISSKDMKKTKQVISRIYHLINDEHHLGQLKKATNEEEAVKYLDGKK